MENFKLSKTGIIIIAISVAIVILLGIVFYVANKKQQQINKLQQENKPVDNKNNAIGEPKVEEDGACCADEQYYPIFDRLKAGNITAKNAIKESGLSVGTFYRKLRKYEKA